MATSQNGWPVYTTSTGLVPLNWVTGRVKPGDVHYIFDHLCRQIHTRVEPIRRDWSWGWAYRAIRGQISGFSNHASATAIDLNAPAHPLGQVGTFSKRQVEEIHAILMELDGVIRWGGDYSGRKDEMHWEINASPEAVKRVVDRLKANNVVYPKVDAGEIVYQNIKVGRSGTVEAALDALGAHKPTVIGLLECVGNWAAIRRWAKANGYSIYTGRIGDEISSNGALLVRHGSGVTDHGYTTISTPWFGPKGKKINGRTSYWVDLVIKGEPTRVFLFHFPWGYGKVVRNALCYIQVARLQRRWASFHVATKNLCILQDGNLSAVSRMPYSPRGTANKIGAKIIGSRGVDQVMWRAKKGSVLKPTSRADTTSRLGSDHYPLITNV